MRNHAIFRTFDPEEDSCITATLRADERYRRRLRSSREDKEPPERARYVADDSDLPSIFWTEDR